MQENELGSIKKGNKSKKGKVFTIILTVLIVIMATMLITVMAMKSAGYFLVVVDGASMEDTIKDGDKLVAKSVSKVSYGDIVVISGEAGYDLIKRVIAVEGQTVELIDGKVYVDGEMLEESYAKGETEPLTAKTVWVLKEGEIFYLGDNRENSSDSRSSYDICSLEQIEGVICGWSLKLRPLNNFFFRFA